MKRPRLRLIARWLWSEIVHAAYATGMRSYCFPCDSLRWRWTHRDCCARNREIGRRIATLIGDWRASDGR